MHKTKAQITAEVRRARVPTPCEDRDLISTAAELTCPPGKALDQEDAAGLILALCREVTALRADLREIRSRVHSLQNNYDEPGR